MTAGELKNFRVALKVEHSYNTLFDSYALILAAVNIALLIICLLLKYPDFNRLPGKRVLFIRFGVLLLTVIIYAFIYLIPMKDIYINSLIYNENPGAFVTLNESIFETYYTDVSEERADEIISAFEGDGEIVAGEVHKPNIIVVMSESFWDTSNLADYIKSSRDPMEEYYRIADTAISGECAVDVFGGGTTVSEWEFNTGCTMGNPYGIQLGWHDFDDEKYSTLVTYLKDQGYYTMALHGYNGTFYGRDAVYPNMGFDAFYDESRFVNKYTYNGYISDKSMTGEIEYRYEEARTGHRGMPLYIFAVSIQNHIYDLDQRKSDEKDPENSIKVSVDLPDVNEESRKKLEKYFNGIALTNEALAELIDYFAGCEEDTVIIFFGDHAPGIAELSTGIYKDGKKYRTPYLIWTNYANDYYSPGDINLSYLSTVILDQLNMPDTMLTKKNRYMMKRYKINTLYEKTSSFSDDEKIAQYAADMYNEKILYGYFKKKNKSNAYMWDALSVR